jgi:predicted permease
MGFFGQLRGGLRRLFFRSREDRELDHEIKAYLDLAAQDEAALGSTPAEAMRRARARFGGVESAKEEVRSGGWESWIETLLKDLGYAARQLRHRPGVTIAAVASLAFGIGANTAIFSLVSATLLQRLPVADLDRLHFIQRNAQAPGVFSYPAFADLRDQNRDFEGMLAWGGITVSLAEGEAPELAGGIVVTGNFFSLLGVEAERGRLLTEADDVTPGAHPVLVVSYAFWKTRLGGREDVVGHPVRLNGQLFTIVGVAPAEFQGAQLGVRRDLFVPMMMQALVRPPRGRYSGEMNPDLLQNRGNSWLFVVGKLKPGVNPELARARLDQIIPEAERPPVRRDGTRPAAVGLASVAAGDPVQRDRLVSVARLLLVVVGLVLLVACANVANLLLARAAARRHEIVTRLSLGASRGRLIRQLLTEAVLLAGLGGAAGWLLAFGAIRALRAAPAPPGALPIQIDFSMDPRVFWFTLLLSLVTGIGFGLAPALKASRLELVSVMKGEGFVVAGGRRIALRDVLVVAQMAMSLVLLVSAGLLLQSLRRTQAIDPGFEVDRLVTAPLNVNLLRYTRDQGRQFYQQVVDRAATLPGAESATLARWIPLSGGGSVSSLAIEGRTSSGNRFSSEGGGLGRNSDPEAVTVLVAGPNFFRTMGIPLLRGRDFGPADSDSAPPVAIVNQAFERLHFPGEDPIGRRFSQRGPEGPWVTIIGVAQDIRYTTLTTEPDPLAWLPLAQNHETGMQLLVRTTRPEALLQPVAGLIHTLEPSLPATGVQPMSATISSALYVARAGARLLSGFGILALLLAAIGLYGVLSYTVARQTREIAVRMAVGAPRGRVLREVLRKGIGLVLIGVVVGTGAGLFATGLVENFLYGVGARDPVTFVMIPVLLLAIALPACLLPARRATRVDPMDALRQI